MEKAPWAASQASRNDLGGPPPRTRRVGTSAIAHPTTAKPVPKKVEMSDEAVPDRPADVDRSCSAVTSIKLVHLSPPGRGGGRSSRHVSPLAKAPPSGLGASRP